MQPLRRLRAYGLHLCLVLAGVSMSGPSVQASVEHALGIARDAASDKVRYIEHHQYLADGSHRIDYYSPTLDRLAYKRLTYPGLPQHPTIIQENLLTQVRVEFTSAQGRLTMRTTSPASADTTSFELRESLVVDAGFVDYIRAHWDELINTDKVKVDFAIAGQGRLLSVNIRREAVRDGNTWFRIEPANWFIRALVPQINVAYDDQRRLSAYRGLSGVKGNDGDSESVTIEFDHYQLEGTLEVPRQDWLPDSIASRQQVFSPSPPY